MGSPSSTVRVSSMETGTKLVCPTWIIGCQTTTSRQYSVAFSTSYYTSLIVMFLHSSALGLVVIIVVRLLPHSSLFDYRNIILLSLQALFVYLLFFQVFLFLETVKILDLFVVCIILLRSDALLFSWIDSVIYLFFDALVCSLLAP